MNELVLKLDRKLPTTLEIGKGIIFPITGWAHFANQKLHDVYLIIDGIKTKIALINLFRTGDEVNPKLKNKVDFKRKGFFYGLQLNTSNIGNTIELAIELVFKHQTFKQKLGAIKIIESQEVVKIDPKERKNSVAICMATYNPPINLVRRQIQSIQNQSHKNWKLIISDDFSDPNYFDGLAKLIENDSRISLIQSKKNLGYYNNFEIALKYVGDFEFVCFADQDDEWYPIKLEKKISRFTENTTLVYSDMKIVDDRDQIISNTYWKNRNNQFTDFDMLCTANTVTGAASMFKKSILQIALPFPLQIKGAYHDHWLAICALKVGKIEFINEPLYNYIQHNRNIIGHNDFKKPKLNLSFKFLIGLAYNCFVIITHKSFQQKIEPMLRHCSTVFHTIYIRLFLNKQIVQLRTGNVKKGNLYQSLLKDRFAMLPFHLKVLYKKFSTNILELNLLTAINILPLASKKRK